MNISENEIRLIVEQVAARLAPSQMQRVVDKSGIISVKTSTVRCEPFMQQGVRLKDVVSLKEAPRMGCGVMELDAGTSFAWKLDYDEYDYVISGTLEIEIEDRVIKGDPGDIILIPKGSSIHFRTPDSVRYAYFVYPADWQNKEP